jgi:quercetin dioxygenase-like cupin family protein
MQIQYRFEKWNEIYAPNPAMLRHVLASEGYKVFQWCDQPNRSYAQHKHGEDQSHWIVSGQLELTIENFGTVLLEAGDRDFMPAETYHSARVIGDEPVIYLVGEKQSIDT